MTPDTEIGFHSSYQDKQSVPAFLTTDADIKAFIARTARDRFYSYTLIASSK